MKLSKKILAAIFTMVVVTAYAGSSVFASEATQTISEPVKSASINNTLSGTATDNTVGNDSSVGNDSNDIQDQVNDTDITVNDQGQVFKDGVLIDEQGEVLTPEDQGEISDDADAEVTEDISDKKDSNTVKNADKDKKDSKDNVKDKADDKPSYSEKDLRLLSALIYAEAGGQPYEGQLGVANIILNRLKSDAFWHVKSIRDVIYDRKWSVQFAVTVKYSKTGTSAMSKALKCYDTDPKTMQRAIKAAKAALEGENSIGNFLCFQNKRYTNSIKKKYPNYKVIGDHIFYRTK